LRNVISVINFTICHLA